MIKSLRDTVALQLNRLKGDGVGAILARGASGAFIVKVAGAGLAFIAQVVLARIMGVENFGVYIYVISWIAILSTLGKSGLDTSAIRFVASYSEREEWGLLRGFYRRSRQMVLSASIVTAAITASVVLFYQTRLSDELVLTFFIGCLLLPVQVFLQIHSAFLQGFKKIVQSQASLFIFRPVFLIGGVFCAFIIAGEAVNPYTAMFIDLSATFGALLITYLFFRASQPGKFQTVSEVYRTDEWIRVSIPLLFLSGFGILLNQTDIVMLGLLKGSSDSGIYAAASKTSQLISFGLVAINAIAAPMISQLYSQKKMDELQRMVKLAALGIFAFSVPVCLFIIIFGKFILGLFGPSFIDSYYPLVILSIGQLVNSLAGSVGYIMTMTGHQKQAAIVFGASAVINIVLNFLLIPLFGLIGAALATSVTLAMWNIALLIYVKRNLMINPTILAFMERK